MKRLLILFCTTFYLSACYSGIIYTHVREPYFKNIKNNTVVADNCYKSNLNEIKDPLFTPVKAQWGSISPTKVIKEEKLATAPIVDIEKESYFFGLWSKKTIWVCSSKKKG